jgi:hypothetical protein
MVSFHAEGDTSLLLILKLLLVVFVLSMVVVGVEFIPRSLLAENGGFPVLKSLSSMKNMVRL